MIKNDSEGRVKKRDVCMKSVFTGLFLGFVVLAFTASAETIDGRNVYVDNSRLYFNAFPHTIQTGDDEIKFDFISKQFSGDIDIAIGFDTNIIKPESAEIDINGEWIDVSSAFNKVTYNYHGMDSWYYTKNINVNAGQLYNLRIKFDVLSKGSGKYWICAKPSSQSIIEAVQSDNFLCLDPWFNVSFLNKNAIFANASVSSDTTMLIAVNITISGSEEIFWGNFTVNATNATVGFVYWNDETDYITVNKEEDEEVLMIMDEGNESSSGLNELSMFTWITGNSSSVVDISRYGLTYAKTGDATTTSGMIGKALSLDNGDKYTFGDYDGYADELSVSTWVYLNDIESYHTFISSYCTGDFDWNLFFHDGLDKMVWYVRKDGSTVQETSSAVVSPNTWYHVVGVRNTTHNCIYLNGELSGEGCEAMASGIQKSNTDMIFGDDCFGNDLDGFIDNTQVYNRSLSPDEVRVLYDTIVPTLPDVAPTETLDVLIINFVSQTPIDITSTNLMNETANITFNITGEDLNLSTIRLETVINSSTGISYINVNGISFPMNISFNFSFNVTVDFTTILGDNDIYPASYAVDDETMEDSAHSVFTSINDNNLIKTTFFNISNSTRFSLLEIMTNSSTGVCDLIYCNSSFTTGSVTTNNNCGGFGEIQPNTPYNHTHPGTGRSAHLFIPLGLDVTDGTISGIQVTPESHIIVRGSGCNTFYISNNTGTAQTSVNNGATWTSQAWTIDAHIHQFNDDETLYYRQCAKDTSSVETCSDLIFDNLDITPLPPSAPFIITPQEGIVQGVIDITYEECISPIGNVINYYNISLLYTNLTFFDEISNNNSLNLNFTWDSELVLDDDYIIEVNCVDNATLNTSAFSGTITVLNNVTISIPVSASFCSSPTNLFTREVTITRTLIGSVWVENITVDINIFNCPNGCSNESISSFGTPGCTESDLQWALYFIIIVIIGGLLIWLVQR